MIVLAMLWTLFALSAWHRGVEQGMYDGRDEVALGVTVVVFILPAWVATGLYRSWKFRRRSRIQADALAAALKEREGES